MQILILGASSVIGAALAEEFASGNSLVLVGRDEKRLAAAGSRCEGAGAAGVRCVAADFTQGIGPVLRAIEGVKIDLVIDAASAASGKRDSEVDAGDFKGLVAADVTSRIELFEHVLGREGPSPAVIFVSSALTLVKSPGRSVYSSLKGLYGSYLGRLRDSRPDLHLLVVNICTVIDPKKGSKKAQSLAIATVGAIRARRRVLFFGMGGAAYLGMYFLQPLAFHAVTLAQRRLRKLLS
jgi:short-subunit dehydrogenase